MTLVTTNTFSNFLPVLNGKLTDIFDSALENEVAASIGMQLFDVQDSDNYNSAYQALPSYSGIKKIAQGSSFDSLTTEQGYKKIYTTSRYGGSFEVSKEEMRYIAQKFPEIARRPELLITDCMDKIDQSMADVLNNARSTSYTDTYGETVDATTADGVAFASASHKTSANSSAYSNIILYGSTSNPALERAAVVAGMVQGMNYTNGAGQKTPVRFDTLIVGPAYADLADRITNSEYIQGSNNNDVNGMVGRLKVVVWERLTTTKWFLANSKKAAKNTLMMRFGQRPFLTTPDTIPQTQTLYYGCDYMNHLVIGDPRFVFCSNGTNS